MRNHWGGGRTRRGFLAATTGVLTGCAAGPESGDVRGNTAETADATGAVATTDGQMEPITTSVPSFHYDAQNSGSADAGPSSKPERRLRAPIDGALRSPPAIADGVVYLGSIHGVLQAVSTRTGEVLWSESDTRWQFEGIRRTPAIADGVVYYTTELGTVVARATDGTRLWTFQADESPRSNDATRVYGSDPVVVDGRVFVNSGDGVYAVDARNGALRWKVPVATVVPGAPAFADGAVYFGRPDGYVAAIGADSGDPLWGYDMGYGVVSGSPTIADGTVYSVATDGAVDENRPSVLALDAADGTEQWTFETDRNVAESAAVADGVVYLLDNTPALYALDTADGTELWRRDLRGANSVTGAPTVADDTIYVGTGSRGRDPSRLLGFDTDGNQRWAVPLDIDPEAAPTVADGRVVLVEDRTIAFYR